MEHYSCTRTEGGLHVEGFPDAVKLIKLDDHKARRVADLLLHQHDLEFADACLEAINKAPVDPPTIREALWRCAIVHFVKCFGSSAARFQLNREKIYKNEPPEAMQSFEYFKHLRDKHVVHDANSYSQSIPGAVLNRGDMYCFRRNWRIRGLSLVVCPALHLGDILQLFCLSPAGGKGRFCRSFAIATFRSSAKI